jgi:FAD:protein FMN transferase
VSPEQPEVFRSMGVDVRVGGATAAELAAIARLFADWERAFSRFRRDSELNRVNSDAAGVVVLSRLFAWVLREALGAAAATGGLVDPTLGQAIAAAGYDRDFSSIHFDDPSEPGPAQPGQWRSLRLTGRLLARPPGLALDLNGVVKAGGDVAARGGTVVGLPGGESLRLLSGGVATSGTTRRRWRRRGELQHHLLDPRSGRPSSSRWQEATVAASTCVAADVAAKAAFLLGEDGPEWLDERGLPGRFLADGAVHENASWLAQDARVA